MHSDNSLCRVCGLNLGNELPWGLDGQTASFNICPCCGVEFGYEDATLDGIARFRDDWIANGGVFLDKSQQPPGWDRTAQLRKIGVSDDVNE